MDCNDSIHVMAHKELLALLLLEKNVL